MEEPGGRSRGSGGSVRTLTSALPAQPTRPARPRRRGRGRCRTYGRADAPTGPCKTAPTRFRTSAHRHHVFVIRKTGTERPGERSPDFYASTWLATVWEVKFRETATPSLWSQPISGSFWLDPSTGRVVRSAIAVRGKAPFSDDDGQLPPRSGDGVVSSSQSEASHSHHERAVMGRYDWHLHRVPRVARLVALSVPASRSPQAPCTAHSKRVRRPRGDHPPSSSPAASATR